jgi:hypothetical protein
MVAQSPTSAVASMRRPDYSLCTFCRNPLRDSDAIFELIP